MSLERENTLDQLQVEAIQYCLGIPVLVMVRPLLRSFEHLDFLIYNHAEVEIERSESGPQIRIK